MNGLSIRLYRDLADLSCPGSSEVADDEAILDVVCSACYSWPSFEVVLDMLDREKRNKIPNASRTFEVADFAP